MENNVSKCLHNATSHLIKSLQKEEKSFTTNDCFFLLYEQGLYLHFAPYPAYYVTSPGRRDVYNQDQSLHVYDSWTNSYGPKPD